MWGEGGRAEKIRTSRPKERIKNGEKRKKKNFTLVKLLVGREGKGIHQMQAPAKGEWRGRRKKIHQAV